MDGDAQDGLRGQPIATNPRQCRVKAGTAPDRRGDLDLPGVCGLLWIVYSIIVDPTGHVF
jgi:hypothetical protein